MISRPKLILFFVFLFTLAASLASEVRELPAHFAIPDELSDFIHSNVKYLDFDGRPLKCPTLKAVMVDKDFDDIENFVENISFDPECLWGITDMFGEYLGKGKIQGFSIGGVIEASLYIGAMFGSEFVMMPFDEDHLLVGMVKFRGGDLGLGLPGVSLVQSMIYGDCPNYIWSYLGWFKGKSGMGVTSNHSIKFPFLDETRSYCDSVSSIRGVTFPAASVSYTEYLQLGQFILLTGPRVRPMIRYVEALNRAHN